MHEFTDPGKLQPTIITKYLPNGSLKDNLIKQQQSTADPNWTPTKRYITLLGISDAMRYLHEHDVIHRDLKPENILTCENYYPRICNFGLSRCFPGVTTRSMKLAELISQFWSVNTEESPSFKVIFEQLQTDFSFFTETVDQDEINDLQV